MRNKSFRRIVTAAVTAILAAALLVGCGSGASSDGGDSADKVIKVGASPSPHAEIFNAVASEVEAQGYTLEVIEFEDYVKPNQALTDGDIDANYFQHKPYLDEYNSQNGTDLASAAVVHYEPLGIYKGTKSDLADLAEGDKVGVPNDTTNEARALQLLQAQGVITLKDGAGLTATKADIIDNPKNIEIVELEAAALPNSLPDLTFGIINGNYALGAGLKGSDTVATEAKDSEAANTYGNILAVRAGEENSEKTQVLVKALTSETAGKFIEGEYEGVVLPLF